jgi:hypothetical protein
MRETLMPSRKASTHGNILMFSLMVKKGESCDGVGSGHASHTAW